MMTSGFWRLAGWPSAEEWQAFWAMATFIVAAVAALYALKQYRASVESHLQQARPYVIIDYAFDDGVSYFEVKNTGLTAAENVRFAWSTIPQALHWTAQDAIERRLVKSGIPFLAPGRVVRFILHNLYDASSMLPAEQRRFDVTLSYTGSADRREWTNSAVLDLDQWGVVPPLEWKNRAPGDWGN